MYIPLHVEDKYTIGSILKTALPAKYLFRDY